MRMEGALCISHYIRMGKTIIFLCFISLYLLLMYESTLYTFAFQKIRYNQYDSIYKKNVHIPEQIISISIQNIFNRLTQFCVKKYLIIVKVDKIYILTKIKTF